MNLTVYALNSILETPQCQKFKLASAAASKTSQESKNITASNASTPSKQPNRTATDSSTATSASVAPANNPVPITTTDDINNPHQSPATLNVSPRTSVSQETAPKSATEMGSPGTPVRDEIGTSSSNTNTLRVIVNKLKESDKAVIANVIAETIVTLGAGHIEDKELHMFLERLLNPAVTAIPAVRNLMAQSGEFLNENDENSGTVELIPSTADSSVFSNLGTNTSDISNSGGNISISFMENIPATKGVGRALPLLPTYSARWLTNYKYPMKIFSVQLL